MRPGFLRGGRVDHLVGVARGRLVGERAGRSGRLLAAAGARDDRVELGFVPPAEGVEVDGREGAVE